MSAPVIRQRTAIETFGKAAVLPPYHGLCFLGWIRARPTAADLRRRARCFARAYARRTAGAP